MEMLVDAKELGRSGATDFDIAAHFCVSESTIQRWRASDKAFDDALRLGKDLADDRVERSLYHKALGYTFRSEKIFQHNGEIIRAETVEHVPPDTTSMIFWLKNRRRTEWTDQQQLNLTGSVDVNVKADPKAMAIAMLATIRAALEQPDETPTIEHQEPAK